MREKTVTLLAVAIAVAGVATLFAVSQTMETGAVPIGEITITSLGDTVRVCGQVTARRVSNSHIFWDIQDASGSIRLVAFNSTTLKLNKSCTNLFAVQTGQQLCATALVDEFPAHTGTINLVYRKSSLEQAE
jgi:aspartyl-tRNA synthetase